MGNAVYLCILLGVSVSGNYIHIEHYRVNSYFAFCLCAGSFSPQEWWQQAFPARHLKRKK